MTPGRSERLPGSSDSPHPDDVPTSELRTIATDRIEPGADGPNLVENPTIRSERRRRTRSFAVLGTGLALVVAQPLADQFFSFGGALIGVGASGLANGRWFGRRRTAGAMLAVIGLAGNAAGLLLGVWPLIGIGAAACGFGLAELFPPGRTRPASVVERRERPGARGWLLGLGIALVTAGTLSAATGWVTRPDGARWFGALLLASGVLQMLYALAVRESRWRGRTVHLLVATSHLAMGGWLIGEFVDDRTLAVVSLGFVPTMLVLRTACLAHLRSCGFPTGTMVAASVMPALLTAALSALAMPSDLGLIGVVVGSDVVAAGIFACGFALLPTGSGASNPGTSNPLAG